MNWQKKLADTATDEQKTLIDRRLSVPLSAEVKNKNKRDRKIAAGLVRLDVWVLPESVHQVKSLAEKDLAIAQQNRAAE